MTTLDQLQPHLRNLLTEELDKAFPEIKKYIPPGTKKFDTLLLLEGRHAELQRKAQRGVLSTEEQRLEADRIREQLLEWINSLETQDLEPAESKTGPTDKRYFWWIGLTILSVAFVTWLVLRPEPVETQGKKSPAGADTTIQQPEQQPGSDTKTTTGPPDTPATTHLPGHDENPSEEPENDRPQPELMEVNLLVPILWRESEVEVDGQPVAPVQTLATKITLALTPGAHEIRLILGDSHCVAHIVVRETGQRIPVTCD